MDKAIYVFEKLAQSREDKVLDREARNTGKFRKAFPTKKSVIIKGKGPKKHSRRFAVGYPGKRQKPITDAKVTREIMLHPQKWNKN